MNDLDYIRNFSKINISGICRKYKFDRSNIVTGRTTKEKIKIVREEIESEIAKLYIKNEGEMNE